MRSVHHKLRLSVVGAVLCIGITASAAVGVLGSTPETPTLSTPTPVGIFPAAMTAASCTNLANWQCVETRPGLSLCRANNVCVVKVDLNTNTLRPRVVIAPGGGTAWLSDMASGAGALSAINGDYFSGCPDTTSPLNCGEGLTYMDGTDYTDYTGSEWQNRRSLGFNDNYDPNIGRPDEQGGYHRYVLGGGPQVTFGGEYRWRCWYQGSNTEGNCACQDNTVVINDELFGCSANNWWNRPQTFVGFSDDRNTLYLAVSEPGYNKTPHEMHDVLWVEGARYSLKMDGGGSSGMYFNDGGYSFAWNGSRAVANAWVIVPYSAPPPTATPPPNCNPNADQVALFVDPNYGRQCVVKGIGEYANPGAIGLPNDAISSLKVGGNVQAMLCRDDNYGGTCETFTGDDPNLGDNSIGDNQVSSVKVQWRAQPPAVPSLQSPADGTAFNEGQGVNLSWSATGSEYYGEVWGGPGGTLTFGWQGSTSKDIGSHWAGYTYSWHVKARNGVGESGWSSTWTFTVRPAAPSNLTAQVASCSQVNLSWNDNSGNEEGYRIYRNGAYVGQVGMNASSYQDSGLSGNTGYSYYVKAFRGGIESDSSSTVNITTPPCASSKPDLRPYTPSGYPSPVVPSSIPGTHTANTLYAGHSTYFDWHFINSGDATAAGNFYVELWVDSTRYVRYPYSDYGAGWTGGFDDWMETIPTSGWRTVRLVADPDNTVTESDEGNNAWEQSFYWTPVTGWWGEYFNLTLSGSPALVRDDPAINFAWAYGSPGSGVNTDFSARWTRSLNFNRGTYRFSVFHDDGARLWVDGVLVLDQWGTCCRTDTASVLLAGGSHSLRMEMFDSGGVAAAQLAWEKISLEVYLPRVVRNH